MAMTPPNGDSAAGSESVEHLDLQIAMESLRDHTNERWVEVSDTMLAAILAKSRPSHPIRGQAGPDTFHVSEQVLTNYVLDAVDPIPHVEVDAIRIHADQDRYTGITIVITARHGLPLLPVADTIREAARDRLAQVLGEQVPPISVEKMRVHVEDVTPGDPSLG